MEKLNLVELLKDCPKNKEFYSSLHGYVLFDGMYENALMPGGIEIGFTIRDAEEENGVSFLYNGFNWGHMEYGCTLWPSKENKSWGDYEIEEFSWDNLYCKRIK